MVLTKIWRSLTGRPPTPAELEEFTDRAMRRYCEENPEDTYASKSYPYDKMRLAKSLEWLWRVDLRDKRLLELGGYSIAAYVLESHFPRNKWVRTDFDMRDKFPYADGSFDVLVNMEVTEHICDIEYRHATTLSGVRQCLEECHRVLRRGGSMFLTTPNACSFYIIQRAMRAEPPWQYPYHFREFTPQEIRELVQEAGFEVTEMRTETVWYAEDYSALMEYMKSHGYPLEDRGDDTFLLARRPNRG